MWQEMFHGADDVFYSSTFLEKVLFKMIHLIQTHNYSNFPIASSDMGHSSSKTSIKLKTYKSNLVLLLTCTALLVAFVLGLLVFVVGFTFA